MMQIGNKLFIQTKGGVNILIDSGTKQACRRFIANSWYDDELLSEIIGTDKPKRKLKAR